MSLTDKERLAILVHVTQGRLPEAVLFRGKNHSLTKREKMVAGRAIWYIIMLGHSCSSACDKARQKFRTGKKSVIVRAVKMAMPDGYPAGLEKAKRKVFMEKLEQVGGGQLEAAN